MLKRREFLGTIGAAAAAAAVEMPFTEFQIACMTLAYAQFPVERGLEGIARAGYRYVAFGPRHQNADTIPEDAPTTVARDLARRARDLGLEPVMMFGVYYIEEPKALEVYRRRIEQAAAAGIPNVLAFGSPQDGPGDYGIWVRHLREIGPLARASGVRVAIKQHGGNTATGRECARIVREVADQNVRMFYDAGNTWWYAGVDPIPDLPSCAEYIHGFAIKDYRAFPQRATCGAGYGIIDHYQLLAPVLRTGRKIVLACENISEPYIRKPEGPAEKVDQLARHAREYLETVIAGLRAGMGSTSTR